MSSESVRTATQPPQTHACPECGGRVDTHGHEPHCVDCGLVTDDTPALEEGYVGDREAVNPERHDRGLGNTLISFADRRGNHTEAGKKRLRLWQRRVQSGGGRERSLAYGLTEVGRITGALGVDSTTEDLACRLLRSASKAGIFAGYDLDGFAAAAVYAACRVNGLPYGRPAVKRLARHEENIDPAYDALRRELGLAVPPAAPSTFVARIGSDAGVPDEVTARARDVAEALDGTQAIAGRKPQAVAAGCIYYAACELGSEERSSYQAPKGIRQADLAEAAGCCTPTLRKTVRLLEEVR